MGSDSLMVLHDRVVVVGGGLVQSCDLVEVVLHACGGWTRGVIGVCVRVRVRVRESPWMRTEPLTRLDVLQQHPDVLVAVRAGLLMVEAQGVQQLVLHSVVVQAALTTQGHRLGVTGATHEGIAPTIREAVGGRPGLYGWESIDFTSVYI